MQPHSPNALRRAIDVRRPCFTPPTPQLSVSGCGRSRAVAGLVLVFAATANAQLVTVTTAADVIDINPQTATIQDLPGPDGKVSFSEAMIATNNTPGPQTIGFAIPRSEWSLQFVLPGRAVLTSSVGYYFRAFDAVTIDGTTQTAFTGDTNPAGWEVAFYGVELFLNADDCTLVGIDSSSVSVSGARGSIVGNTGTMNISLFGGGNSRIQGNRCGTIKIDRSDANVVVGNTAQRLRVLGFGSASPVLGNRIGGPTLAERNFFTGYGTWNSEGLPAGAAVQLFANADTVIENNWIGTTEDGMAQGNPACNMGIDFEGSNRGVVVRDNLIAGILGQGRGPHYAGQVFGWAVYFAGDASDIELRGNTIGLDASGAPTLGSVWGIEVGHASRGTFRDIRIGGDGPGDGNVIAGHRFNGVTVGNGADGVRLRGNSIHGNAALGIDLVPTGFGFGPTPNDPLDADTGGNGLQNFPVLATAASDGAHVRLTGTVHSTPASTFILEFFASPSCDGSGHGEGQVALGATTVTTNGNGDAVFSAVLAASAPVGWVATATATAEPSGATSEFSMCLPIGGMRCQPDLGFQGPGTATATLCGPGLAAGQNSAYDVTGAPADGPGALLVSRTGLGNVPIFGGTLVSFLGYAAHLMVVADGDGHLRVDVAGFPPPALDLVLQAVFLDASLPQGIAFTNAMLARFGQ